MKGVGHGDEDKDEHHHGESPQHFSAAENESQPAASLGRVRKVHCQEDEDGKPEDYECYKDHRCNINSIFRPCWIP